MEKVKIEIEFEVPISVVTKHWLEVDLRSFLHYKWKAYESVGDKTKIQVRLLDET